LLESDLEERPAATLPQRREYLRTVCGVEVSDSTLSRMLGRMGWSRKKDRWVRVRETSGRGQPGASWSPRLPSPSVWSLSMRSAPTPRLRPCMPGRAEVNERFVRRRATGERTSRSWRA
jgi:hypothetical protein